jgi:hypothetical protein
VEPVLSARRGRIALALAVLVSLAALLTPTGTASALRATGTDSRIGASDCALLGRTYVAGRGCSRERCLRGAHPYKAGVGVELCALPRQGGHAYASAVDYRRCAALHRRWIAEVNWCASNPDRSVAVIRNAPQCTGRATTYLTHTEREGYYDECVTPRWYRKLHAFALHDRNSVRSEALDRSRVLCSYRAGRVFVGGQCRVGHDPAKLPGGVLLVGDSITWRGTDELGRLRPDLTIDGIPGRRFSDLAGRLSRYRVDHGNPDGLIVELGTNNARRYREDQLTQLIGTLPATTKVMLVLPWRQGRHGSDAHTTMYAEWMRALAAARPNTCTADWRSVVEQNPRLLVDGVHPRSSAESFWASWLADQWSGC